MPMRKNIKIASVKRGHHEKHKKNFLKSKKQLVRDKQARENIFKKKNLNDSTEVVSSKKKNVKSKINELPAPPVSSSLKISDIYDMLSDMEEEENDDGPSIESNDSENEEITEKMELDQRIRQERRSSKKIKELLPIKTNSGVVPRSMETENGETFKVEEESDEDLDEELNEIKNIEEQPPQKKRKLVTATELLGEREQEFNYQKFRIGKTCSSITERPEERIGSFKTLLDLMQEHKNNKEKNLISVRRLAMLSTMEVFKDIIPDYKIGVTDLQNQKVKKDTLARVTFENELLKYYKKYLQLVEACAKALKPGKYAKRPSKEEIYMAEIAVQCLCELLLAHVYSNYSTNIAQVLVIYLNCYNASTRKRVNETFVKLFKTDRRLDLSRHVVRNINYLVKKKSHSVFTEVISCLLALQIKSINPEAEKEEELKRKKMEQQKSKLISMSKRERKRKKKLADLEKEMMETEAEENKQSKQTKLTDISKLVFTIYFRILKECPKSRLLSTTLEGLAKFAHIINIEFFSDLIEVLHHLIENAELGYREQLHCIQTVFAILSGQGEALNIDPARFYKHLYQIILCVNAGKNHEDTESIIVTLENVLIKRRKNITQQRYLAFLKRLMTLSLQLLHNGSLGCMALVKNAMQLNSMLDILLDTENKIGSGKFDPTINDPEFCNSNCTSLFELTLLQRHYHSVVSKMAKYILGGCQVQKGSEILGSETSKLSPLELFNHYNSNEMAFNPAIPAPSSQLFTKEVKSITWNELKLKDLKEICLAKTSFEPNTKFDFFKEFK